MMLKKSPEIVRLKSEDLTITVRLDSDCESRYGDRRFDHLGRVTSVKIDGVEFLESDGLADEFSPQGDGLLGWEPMQPSDRFVKIGVGILQAFHAAKPYYMNAQPHTLIEPFETKTAYGDTWFDAKQVINLFEGYAYNYTKRIEIDGEQHRVKIHYTLQNTGNIGFSFDQYNHAYLSKAPEAQFYEMKTSFAIQQIENTTQPNDSVLIENRAIPTRRSFNQLEDSDSKTLDLVWPNGRRVRAQQEPGGRRIDLYQDETSICPEYFFAHRLSPGQTVEWTRSYTFNLPTKHKQSNPMN